MIKHDEPFDVVYAKFHELDLHLQESGQIPHDMASEPLSVLEKYFEYLITELFKAPGIGKHTEDGEKFERLKPELLLVYRHTRSLLQKHSLRNNAGHATKSSKDIGNLLHP